MAEAQETKKKAEINIARIRRIMKPSNLFFRAKRRKGQSSSISDGGKRMLDQPVQILVNFVKPVQRISGGIEGEENKDRVQ